MIDIHEELARLISAVPDLGAVTKAVAREEVIRSAMVKTGESRQIVTEILDASISMDQEAVLDLMDGEPTTLAAGLQRYVEELEKRDDLQPRDRVVSDLETLLAYPWPVASAGPGQELEIRQPNDEHLEVWIGGRKVANANYDDHGWSGMEAVQTTAENVHKALVNRG